MTKERPLTRSFVRILLVTMFVLAIPLVANQFTTGEGWSLFDFILAGGMILGTGLFYEVAVRMPATLASAALTAVIAAVGGAAIVVGEVDDAPGLILLGMVLIGVATAAGFKAARRRPTTT